MASAKPAAQAKKPAPAPAPKSQSKAVATRADSPIVKAGAPEEMLDIYAQHAGAGLENATAQDYALPFIYLLQTNSPAVADETVEGASAGQWMNTVSQRLYGDTIRFIPVDFSKVYNEWVPRDEGGGFVKSWDDKAEAEAGCQEGHQIVDTANHYGLVWNEDDQVWEQAILSMTSTKLKVSRAWLSRISQVMIPDGQGGKRVAPSFARIYELGTEKTKNDKGTFFVPTLKVIDGAEGWVPAEVFEQAVDFRTALQAGKKGADFSRMETEVAAEVEDSEPAM